MPGLVGDRMIFVSVPADSALISKEPGMAAGGLKNLANDGYAPSGGLLV